jgi:hypothetical protein
MEACNDTTAHRGRRLSSNLQQNLSAISFRDYLLTLNGFQIFFLIENFSNKNGEQRFHSFHQKSKNLDPDSLKIQSKDPKKCFISLTAALYKVTLKLRYPTEGKKAKSKSASKRHKQEGNSREGE